MSYYYCSSVVESTRHVVGAAEMSVDLDMDRKKAAFLDMKI